MFLWERLLVGERATMPFYSEHVAPPATPPALEATSEPQQLTAAEAESGGETFDTVFQYGVKDATMLRSSTSRRAQVQPRWLQETEQADQVGALCLQRSGPLGLRPSLCKPSGASWASSWAARKP